MAARLGWGRRDCAPLFLAGSLPFAGPFRCSDYPEILCPGFSSWLYLLQFHFIQRRVQSSDPEQNAKERDTQSFLSRSS